MVRAGDIGVGSCQIVLVRFLLKGKGTEAEKKMPNASRTLVNFGGEEDWRLEKQGNGQGAACEAR
jgi:hypothetical protein